MTGILDLYPSRIDTEPKIENRSDPIVYTDNPPTTGISYEQVESYRKNGFLFCENLFTNQEIAVFNQELRRLINLERQVASYYIKEPESGIVRSIFSVHTISPVFSELSKDQRLLDIVKYLLNDELYIHQSRVNLKPGFHGKEFYWHSDFETWHVEDGMPRMRAISVSLSLTENSPFNGPLMLVPGSHKKFLSCVGATPENHYKQSLRRQQYGVPDEKSLTKMVNEGGIVAPTGGAGSAVFFDCNTMHGSNSNISPYPRSNVFFVYNSMSNVLQEPFCGLNPRPEFIAARKNIIPVTQNMN